MRPWLPLLGLAIFAGCPKKEPEPLSPPGHVTILHTNDLHGHYLPERADWLPGEPAIGGFVRLEQEVRAIREAKGRENTLLVDGGDILTGTPLTALEEEGARGTPMLRFMEALGYDAWVVGNHEFDRGLENLKVLAGKSTFVTLSANLRDKAGKEALLPNQAFSHVFAVNGVRIGVIGATTDSLRTLVSPKDWARMSPLPVAEAVRAEAARLDPDTDILVALTHIGVDDDKKLAAAVPGLDLIVGGHSHTPLKEAARVGDTWIVQAGSYNRQLGVAELDVANDAIAAFRYELRDLVPATATVEADQSVAAMSAHYQKNIDTIYGEVLARAPAKLEKDYHHESALGRWITDALRTSSNADLAFYNGGGLRSELHAGEVTRRSLFECFPFENPVYTFPVTGEQLVAMLLRNAAADATESRAYLSVSGATWSYRMNAGAPELVAVTVGGQPVDLARTYTAAATSYIVDQWEKFLTVQPVDPAPVGLNDFEAAVAYGKAKGFSDDGQRRGVRIE